MAAVLGYATKRNCVRTRFRVIRSYPTWVFSGPCTRGNFTLFFFLTIFTLFLPTHLSSETMSSHDNEDLIDYEDEHDAPSGAILSATNGVPTTADGDLDKEKKNFSGIHSTGFRYAMSYPPLHHCLFFAPYPGIFY
jgi:hypothetical protein